METIFSTIFDALIEQLMGTTTKDFELFLLDEIQPKLQELEEERKTLEKDGKLKKSIFGVFLFIGLFLTYIEMLGEAETLLHADIGFGIVCLFVVILFVAFKPITFVPNKKQNDLKVKFKTKVVWKSLQVIDNRMVYRPIFKTNKKQLIRSGLFGKFTEHKEDDGLYGEFPSCSLLMSEIHVMNSMKSVFGGLFIRLKFPKEADPKIAQKVEAVLVRGLEVNLKKSVVGDTAYFALANKEPFLEFSLKSPNHEEVLSNLRFLNSLISSVRE